MSGIASADVWRQAFSTRGFLSRKVRARLDAAAGARVEIGSPDTQPFKRNFALIVSRVAAQKFGVGNYRIESLSNPARVAVWQGEGVAGVPAGSIMSRKTSRWLRAYTERRL